MRVLHRALALSLVGASLLVARPAEAKSTRELDYAFKTIWSTTVRLLRVDQGYEITDQDRDNGYLLFVYPGSGSIKRCPASLEIIAFVDEQGYQHHRLQLHIAHQPAYVEVHLLDLIERKLLQDHGRPPTPTRPARSRRSRDRDKDTDRDKDRDKDADRDADRDKDADRDRDRDADRG